MEKYFYAYDIYGHGKYGWEDFRVGRFQSREGAYQVAATEGCDEWCSYGGLHGIGFGEDEIEERLADGMSDEEITEDEWQQAQNEVDVCVYNEEQFRAWLSTEGSNPEEVAKIVLDLSGNL